ncbi:MAG TPA: HEAT repeat domain-containing protein, partial [Gemmataceae bacterium]|nr:HEAT repeat domain-containing protein [Gemmataceae bacterium]
QTRAASDDQPSSAGVDELRRTLRETVPEEDPDKPKEGEKLVQAFLDKRSQVLRRQVMALQSIAELRQALALQEWGDNQTAVIDVRIAKVDRLAREMLADDLRHRLEGFLRGADAAPTTQLAAIGTLAEMGANVRGIDPGTSFAGSLSATLEEVVKNNRYERRVREAAARALGKVDPSGPDTERAAEVLGGLLDAEKEPVSLRRAAADGLAGMMGVVRDLMPFFGDRPSSRPTGVGTSPADLGRGGPKVVTVAAAHLKDPDREVVRACLEAIHATSSALVTTARIGVRAERANLLAAVTRALNEQAHRVASALDRSQPTEIRLLAARILADMGYAQQQMRQGPRPVLGREPLRLPRSGGPGAAATPRPIHLVSFNADVAPAPKQAPLASAADLLRDGLAKKETLNSMADSLKEDGDVRVRLAITEALETLGTSAQPAAPALVLAMGDRNRFVRWSATRTLGGMSPVEGTIAGFVAGLGDADRDVRLAAAEAIRKYGPRATDTHVVGDAGANVVDALSAAVGRRGDAEMRVAAINALQAVQTHEEGAIRALIAALDYSDARVRKAAAAALGSLGPKTGAVMDALLAALRDDDGEVRQAASDALLDIAERAKKSAK